MVYSNINNTVFYNENGEIDSEDIGHESTLYEMVVFGKNVMITFGKLKYTFIQRNIVFIPIYLVVYEKVVKQIGVLEFTKNDVLEILDDEQDVIVDKIKKPITFGFFDKSFIDYSGSDSKSNIIIDEDSESEGESESESEVKEQQEDSDDETFSLKVKPSEKTDEIKKIDEELEKGIFTIDKKIKLLPDLSEETEDTAKEQRKNFEGTPNDIWIQTFIKSSNYNIHDVERNGDCLYI